MEGVRRELFVLEPWGWDVRLDRLEVFSDVRLEL